MMDKNIWTLMEEKSVGFSRGQRAIAKYIADNPQEAALMTAGRMAKAIGVSESTVVRFALELGYDGYPQMQQALQKNMLEKLTPQHEKMPFSFEDAVGGILYEDMKSLKKVADHLDRSAFDGAVQAVKNAGHIYIRCSGSAAALGGYLEYQLRHIRDHVTFLYDNSPESIAEMLAEMESNDALLLLCFGGEAATLHRCALLFGQLGGRVIAFSDKADDWAAADYALQIVQGQVGSLVSLAVPMSILNAFIAALMAQCGERYREFMQKKEQVRSLWETAGERTS